MFFSCIYRSPVDRPLTEEDDSYLLGGSEPELSGGSPNTAASFKPSSSTSRTQPDEVTPLIEDIEEVDDEGYGGYTITPREKPTTNFWRAKPVSNLHDK